MSRAKRCVKWLHWHVGQCNVQGYKNGRADALDEVLRLATAQANPRRTARGTTQTLTVGQVEAIVAEVRANG